MTVRVRFDFNRLHRIVTAETVGEITHSDPYDCATIRYGGCLYAIERNLKMSPNRKTWDAKFSIAEVNQGART